MREEVIAGAEHGDDIVHFLDGFQSRGVVDDRDAFVQVAGRCTIEDLDSREVAKVAPFPVLFGTYVVVLKYVLWSFPNRKFLGPIALDDKLEHIIRKNTIGLPNII